MARKPESENEGPVKEMAGGWITERTGTRIPLFLKLTYLGFGLFGFAYLFLNRAGEIGHATRGPLVRQANEVMGNPPTAWIALLATLIAAFVALLLWFAFRREGADE